MSSEPTLVIDFGSGFVKAGFAGNDSPSLVFPSVIGFVKYPKSGQSSETQIGEEALSKVNELNISRPFERTVLTKDKEEDFKKIVQYIYTSLDIKGENNDVLISKPSGVSNEQLEMITNYFINVMHVPSISFISSAALSLLSTGRVTGIVAECGYGVTNVVPIFEFFGLEHARITSDLGGQDVDRYLNDFLIKLE